MSDDQLMNPVSLNFFKRIFRRKNPDQMVREANKNALNKTLGAWDLTILGIGAIIGAGIFTLAGTAAVGTATSAGAGPSLMLSFILAGISCALTGLCYAEFASMIPVAGSAYTYTFATLGEVAAWTVGWILILEYLIGNVTIASGWSSYLFEAFKNYNRTIEPLLAQFHLPSWLLLPNFVTNPPIWLINDFNTAISKLKEAGVADPASQIPHLFGLPLCINIPAIFVILYATYVLYKGVQESAKTAGLMVAVKLVVLALFLGVGSFFIQPQNWHPFMPNGFQGVINAAVVVFFAYIGFDAVSTVAEETKNPQKNIPIGIIASLAVCTLLYIAVAAVLTGMVNWHSIDVHAPVAAAMSGIGMSWAALPISIGAVAGLTSVLVVLQLGTTRILFSMARDGFFPSLFCKLHSKYKTPHIITWFCGIFVAVASLFLDLNSAAKLCSIGTLAAFAIVCLSVVILRYSDPTRHRPFRVPGAPVVPLIGVAISVWLIVVTIAQEPKYLGIFAVWIAVGLVIYFSYGYKNCHKVDMAIQQAEADEALELEAKA